MDRKTLLAGLAGTPLAALLAGEAGASVGDYSELEKYVARFRNKSPNVAAAFDQVEGHLKRHDADVERLMGVLGQIPSTASVALGVTMPRPPTAADDATAGYSVPTIWTDSAANTAYVLTSAAAGAAIWVQIGTTVTPPPAGLKWERPTLVNPVTVTIPTTGGGVFGSGSTGTNGQFNIWLEAGRDYIFQFQDGLRVGPIYVGGRQARHIQLVGGEHQTNDTSISAWDLRRQWVVYDVAGTFHIEGLWQHGEALTEGWNIQCPALTSIFQWQNCRIEHVQDMVQNPKQHADCVQTWSSNELRFWNVMVSGNHQCFWFSFGGDLVNFNFPRKIILDRVNMRPSPTDLDNVNPIAFLYAGTEYNVGDLWAVTGTTGGVKRGIASSCGASREQRWSSALAFQEPPPTWRTFHADGTPYGPEHVYPNTFGDTADETNGIVQTGDYVEFTRPSSGAGGNIWNLTKTAGGRVYQGLPPGGDFCALGVPGRGYTG